MRTLQVTATYPPSINGVAITVESLKKEYEKLGIEVIVLTPENPDREKKESGIVEYPSIPNPLSKDYPIPLAPGIKTITKLIDKEKPDIVHVHHPFHIGYFAKLIARHYKIPLVFTYHTRYDLYAEHYFKFLPSKLKVNFIQNNVDEFCEMADLIISPSRSVTSDLVERNPNLNVVTISSGLPEIPKEDLSKDQIVKKLRIPKGKKVLLTVSRISEEKNLSLLIKSMKLLNENYYLVVVGGGNYEKKLRDLAVEEKVERKVKFVGLVEHTKLGSYYQIADIFVYPSITETQGLIFLEALSFGLPVVAVKSEASIEWIPKKIGFLTDNTPESFVKGILEMEKRDKHEISIIAMKFTEDYSVSSVARKIIDQYKKLIQQNQSK